jgi:hypothetical protein
MKVHLTAVCTADLMAWSWADCWALKWLDGWRVVKRAEWKGNLWAVMMAD